MIKNAMAGNNACNNFALGTFRFFARAVVGLALAAAVHTPVFGSNFNITPTSLELSGGVKSGVFSVVNSDAEALNCQIAVKEWSQDPDGKDLYADAKDIVVFPKIMTVGPNDQRAVRIGIKGPQSMQERTYRLFVEEIPGQKKTTEAKPSGKITAGLTIAFRYALPIFVKPVRPQESAVIEQTGMSRSVVKTMVKNTGNIHIKLISVTFQGKAADGKVLFSQDVAGWYILHGQSRPYIVTVPKEVCKDVTTIDISAQAENLKINGMLNVQGKMCGQ